MTFVKNKVVLAFILAAVLVALVFTVYAVLPASLSREDDDSLARLEVELCKSATNEAEKEICYQKEVPKLMDEGLTLERAFVVTQKILDLDPGYQSCHVLAHLLSAKEVTKDPSKWKDVVSRVPTGICGTGALHGAFQERFKTDSLKGVGVETMREMLEGVCSKHGTWNPTLLDRSSCFHGMGHLFLYVTAADVQKSVQLCAELANLPEFDFRQTCYEGVFMQANQPLDPEDEALTHDIAASLKNPKKFCGQFAAGLVRDTCIKESWAQDLRTVTTPDGYEALCKQTSPDYWSYCAGANIFAVIETLHYDLPKILGLCRGLKDQNFKNLCWARTAVKVIWADYRNTQKAIDICTEAPMQSKATCWEYLTNHAEQGWHPNTPEVRALCGGMPEPWRSTCAKRTSTVL